MNKHGAAAKNVGHVTSCESSVNSEYLKQQL